MISKNLLQYAQLTKKMDEIWEVPVQDPSCEHVPSQGQAASKTPSTGRAVMLKHICSLCTCLPEPPMF